MGEPRALGMIAPLQGDLQGVLALPAQQELARFIMVTILRVHFGFQPLAAVVPRSSRVLAGCQHLIHRLWQSAGFYLN